MTYDEFKEYLRVFLWKQNDADLLTSLDQLIKLATSELDRKLDINRREVVGVLVAPNDDSNRIALPDDFKHMVSLNSASFLYERVSEGQIMHEVNCNSTNINRPYYAIVGSDILFGMVFKSDATTAQTFEMVYRTKLPDYQAADTSWLEEDYLDLYTYCVLKHTSPWLREDERVQLWISMFQDALNSVLEEDKFNIEYGGSPLKMNMARNPSPSGPATLYKR